MATTGIKAIVKSAVSGDTLQLTSSKAPPPGKAPAERTLSLAFISAPRLRREGDEPYAFQSREFLRRNLVGKEVLFQPLYTVNNREYGIVTIPNGPSIVDLVIGEGLAKVRDDAGKRDDQSEFEPIVEKLRELELKAKDDEKGMYSSSDDGKVDCKNDFPPDIPAFFETWKEREIDTIVERVISGDRMAVRLITEPRSHQQLMLIVAGIRAPLSKRQGTDGADTAGDAYGEEARLFIEQRILQRSVKVELMGLTPQNQLVGQVLHPKGSIAEFILRDGLAKCNDQHSSMLGTALMGKLREAEGAARKTQLKLWSGVTAKKRDGSSTFEAVVSKIQSGDTLYLRNKAGAERKISLSSVRVPPRPEGHADFKVPSYWQAEAKEFLRRKLIGKHVQVSIDGKRPAQGDFEEKEVATVTVGDENVALSLLEAGLANIIHHRRDDDDRSPIWDTLNAAEEAAKAEGKGQFGKEPGRKPIADASESEQKAKSHLSYLQRQKRIPAVVEFIASGSRFKLLIPRESVKLTFVLSGIRAPRTARNPSEKSEPWGPEALEYTSRRANQRDVEIDVEAIDKMNGFIGTMYVNRENIAKGLVEEGLANVHAYSAEQSGHGPELFAAEKLAKEARKGLWEKWTPADEGEEEAANDTANGASEDTTTHTKRQDYKDVVVTNVDESGRLKIQIIGDGTTNQLEKLMAEFRAFHLNKSNDTPLTNPPKVGDIVAAKFSDDGEFYRAKVRHVDRENKKAEISYIDYGNSEQLPFSSLRPLVQSQFSTNKLKAQAIDAVLSFVQFPTGMYTKEAQENLQHLTSSNQLVANIDYTDKDGTLNVTLFESKSPDPDMSVNGDMVADGLAMVAKKLKPWERAYSDRIANLKEKQAEAKKERRGMWEYGDLTEDD